MRPLLPTYTVTPELGHRAALVWNAPGLPQGWGVCGGGGSRLSKRKGHLRFSARRQGQERGTLPCVPVGGGGGSACSHRASGLVVSAPWAPSPAHACGLRNYLNITECLRFPLARHCAKRFINIFTNSHLTAALHIRLLSLLFYINQPEAWKAKSRAQGHKACGDPEPWT